MSDDRRPRGYRGENHETIGSDILAVLDAVTLAKETFGPELAASLSQVEPDAWYPIERLLTAMDVLDAKVGRFGLIKMGRRLWKRTHEPHVAGQFESVADILLGFHAAYRSANRGTGIGGWELLALAPGFACMENTTPHHCAMEEGIILAAVQMLDVGCAVKQSSCFRDGSATCVYELRSSTRDERWMGTHAPFGAS